MCKEEEALREVHCFAGGDLPYLGSVAFPMGATPPEAKGRRRVLEEEHPLGVPKAKRRRRFLICAATLQARSVGVVVVVVVVGSFFLCD